MKTVIVYRSFLGSSEKYAKWLSEGLKADIYKFNKISKPKLKEYDCIVLVGGTYMSWISLSGYMKRMWDILKDKKVIFAWVGISPEGEEYTNKSLEKIPQYIRDNIKTFRLPGKLGDKEIPGTKPVDISNLDPIFEYISKL